MQENKEVLKKLDDISKILRHLLAVELYRANTPQPQIGKLLGISAGSVNALLKGIKKEPTK